ncbi:DoxX-like family protein [Crenobacter cavernae]|nr:DoxX-like family protein [Crenobacter cavernae]
MEWSLAALWLWSGLQPPLLAWDASLGLLARVGLAEPLRAPAFIAACALDVAFGVLSIARPGRRLWLAQAATVAFYSAVLALFLTENWFNPFAPLVKNLPIFAALLWLAEGKSNE